MRALIRLVRGLLGRRARGEGECAESWSSSAIRFGFIELLEEIDRRTPASVTAIHLVCDSVRMHKGNLVQAWLARHPKFRMHFTPMH